MKFAIMHGPVWQLFGKRTWGKNVAGLHCCYPGTVDRHSDAYI